MGRREERKREKQNGKLRKVKKKIQSRRGLEIGGIFICNIKVPCIISFKINVVLQVCVYEIHLFCYQTWLFTVKDQLLKNSHHCTTYWTAVMAKWICHQNACKIKPCSCKKLHMHMKLQDDTHSGKQTLVLAKPSCPWAACHVFSLQNVSAEPLKWGKQLGSIKMSPTDK